MTQKQPTFSDRLVSACNAMLKLLSELYAKTRHMLGLLVIDRGMRDTVAWYDRKHPAGTSRRKMHEAENNRRYLQQIADLRKSVKAAREATETQRQRAEGLGAEQETLRTHIKKLDTALNEAEIRYSSLENTAGNQIHDLEALIATLRCQTDDLLRRCLPESEIPSMVYYAEGDASGLYLRKPATKPEDGHIYRLVTHPGNTLKADFEPHIKANLPYIVENRNVFLTACDIKGISSSPSRIRVIDPGETIMEDGRWKVVRRAVIELID